MIMAMWVREGKGSEAWRENELWGRGRGEEGKTRG